MEPSFRHLSPGREAEMPAPRPYVTDHFRPVSSTRLTIGSGSYIHLLQKTLSERTANGSCRTEIARPKGTVVATFGMQKQCVLHVAIN